MVTTIRWVDVLTTKGVPKWFCAGHYVPVPDALGNVPTMPFAYGYAVDMETANVYARY